MLKGGEVLHQRAGLIYPASVHSRHYTKPLLVLFSGKPRLLFSSQGVYRGPVSEEASFFLRVASSQ